MRIALTHPSCWPYVRRGAERFLSELARFLTRGGHTVVTISAKPGPESRETGDGGERILARQYWFPALGHLRIQPSHPFLVSAYCHIRQVRPDLVHSLYFTDALASALAGRAGRHPTVYYVTGPPVPSHLPRVPPDRWMLRRAITGADAVMAPSQYVRAVIFEHYGIESMVMPVPVDTGLFTPGQSRAGGRPILLSVAAFDDRRKGVRPLIRAFMEFKKTEPDAILRLTGSIPEQVRAEVLHGVPELVSRDIEFLGAGRLEDLPQLYRTASVTVLPSKWEAYGMVLLESWACGTPVVATNHAALPALVTDARTGVLFEPGEGGQEVTAIDALAAALAQGLRLSRNPDTAAICRRKAEAHSWEVLGPGFERAYRAVLDRKGATD